MMDNETATPDRMEKLPCGSLIQHGPYNDRIYFMKPGENMPDDLPAQLLELAKKYGYSKIFAKVPDNVTSRFIASGYLKEAVIPHFYNSNEDGVFLGYYLTGSRSREENAEELDNIVDLALSKANCPLAKLDSTRFSLRECTENDVERMAEIYCKVFPSYPFPIHDPEYLLETMRSHVIYFGVVVKGKLIALSSAEMDTGSSSAEMTDFATLPEWRGNSLGSHLLATMETAMKQRKIKTLYTIARAISPGMNITFARLGYKFAGRLRNNTNISGNIESMNVWHKKN